MKTLDLYAEMQRLRIEARRAREDARKEHAAARRPPRPVPEADPCERRRLAVLGAASRRGSTLRGTFSLWDIEADTGYPVASVAAVVAELERLNRWPYAYAGPGFYRDTRKWFDRIAVKMSAT